MRDAKAIEAVQWGRAIAALSVASGHLVHESSKVAGFEPVAQSILSAFPFGIGVDIFFVISGFIMVFTTDGKRDQTGAATQFIKARIARIVPLYWLYTLLMVAVMLVLPDQFDTARFSVSQLLYSLTFIPGIGHEVRPILSLGWTLNFEMMFYLCFALALVFASQSIVSTLTFLFIALLFFENAAFLDYAPFSFWANPIILEFCAGMFIARLYLRGTRLTTPMFYSLLALFSCALLFGARTIEIYPRIITLGIPAVAIVAVLSMRFHAPDMLHKSGTLRLLRQIGDASYSLYLSHPFVLSACMVLFKITGGSGLAGGMFYLSATFVVITLSAIFAHHLVERPLFLWSRRVLKIA